MGLRFFLSASVVSSFFFVSCAAVEDTRVGVPVSGDSKADQAELQVTGSSQPLDKFYFSKLQILVETKAEGVCDDVYRKSDQVESAPRVRLNDEGKLESEEDAFRMFALDVQWQWIGFDASQYRFQVLDGVAQAKLPFQLGFRRKPGVILELTYLDQVVAMQLRTTPIYTFRATETRGPCTIYHDVNVFSEATAFYPRSILADD